MKSVQLNYIISEWWERAKELTPGQRLHIPVISKDDTKQMKQEFEKLRKNLGAIDPELAHALVIGDRVTKEGGGKMWVTISRRADSPLKGYITSGDSVYKVEIEPSNRRRILMLMARDGYTLTEVEEVLGELDEEEVASFF